MTNCAVIQSTMMGFSTLVWWFNNRKNPWLFGDTLEKLLQSDNFEYRELIAQ